LSQNLSVTLQPSRIFALILTVVAGTALVCSWISLPDLAFVPTASGIILAWIWHLGPALQWGPRAVRSLELESNGDARWQDGSGRWCPAEIRPGSYVSAWLVVVDLSGPGGARRSLVLLPDCAASEDLRQLRVWLRWRLGRK
jgi:hypothetical protein